MERWTRKAALGGAAVLSVPGDDLCGRAVLHRNSDGAELVCHIPRGATSCITGMLNDAGEFDYGKTASY